MTRVFLIRHGHVENPAQVFYGPETPISERGKRQITALGQDLLDAGIHPAAIYASPYLRAQMSAAILSEAFQHLPITTDDRLKEWQVGDWYGKPLKDFYVHTNYLDHPDTKLPDDIEPLADCAARVQATIHEAVATHPSQDVILVAHREPLVSAVLSFEHKSFSGIHALPFHVANCWELTFDGGETPTSVTKRIDRSTLE